MTISRPNAEARLAARFFVTSVTVLLCAAGLAWGLTQVWAPRSVSGASLFRIFAVSTLFLFLGSIALGQALQHVQRERQTPFRRRLVIALVSGTLFVGVQSYGLWCLLQRVNPSEVQTGVYSFVFAFTGLHALHVSVALLFLVFVTLNGFADRYDHEYYWGVSVCTYFWHLLSIVWLCLLAVFCIAM